MKNIDFNFKNITFWNGKKGQEANNHIEILPKNLNLKKFTPKNQFWY